MFKKWMEKSKKDQRGLTLVELLAVVVILAIVAAIAFVLIGNVMENSRKDAHIANAQQIISAAKMYDSTVEPIKGKEITLAQLQEEKLIDKTIQNPWKGETYVTNENVKITKNDDGEFSISAFSVTGKCELTKDPVTESDLNKEGRNLCK